MIVTEVDYRRKGRIVEVLDFEDTGT